MSSADAWLLVSEYDGLYSVSSAGNVRRNLKNGCHKVLSGWLNMYGYPSVALCKNGKSVTRRIHTIVATHFIPNPEGKKTVNHKNGIKTDNRVENLEWATLRENIQHAFSIGIYKDRPVFYGKDHHNSIPIVQMSKSGDIVKYWDSCADAARSLKTLKTSIWKCLAGERKTHLGFKWKYK